MAGDADWISGEGVQWLFYFIKSSRSIFLFRKELYNALFLLMQRIKKQLQRREAKGIGIILMVLQFKKKIP